MLRWRPWLVFLFALAVSLGPARAEGQIRDLKRSWHTVRTEHFEVHYHEPLSLMARRVAEVLERVHQRLKPLLRYEPKSRVQIVLTDGSENANGSATPIHYNIIRLFASAPADLSVLSDFDDWMTLLITHEHAHILHLDNISRLPAVINKIFGKIYAPNLAEPRFIIEGIATYFESAETAAGRLRSTIFEMYMRTAVLENATISIDQLSNQIVQWPQGNIWYLYGGRFVQYIVDKYGESWIPQMSKLYGGTLIPYGLNRSLQKITGKTYIELYDEWLADMKVRYEALEADIRAQGIVEGKRLTFHGQNVRGLRFFNDDEVMYFVADGQSNPKVRSIHVTGPKKKRTLVRSAGVSYPTLHPDGSIYLESFDSRRDLYSFYDLFRADPKKGRTRKRKRLTNGLRARYPDVSPDGTHIVFVRNHAGTSDLYIAETKHIEKTKRVLVKSKLYEQVYTPRYSPDGNFVAYSAWRRGGYRDIHVLDLRTQEVFEVTHDRALDTGPAWSPDGETLYFSSDRTGISNIYAYGWKTGETNQITNVVSGAYQPAPSPDGHKLAYIGYTHLGYDVYAMDLPEPRPAEEYVDNRPPPSEGSNTTTAFSRRYRPGPTLYPRFWAIDFDQDGFGRQLGISVQGQDAAPFFDWRVRMGVSLEEGYVNVDARYSVLRFPAPITLQFFRRVDPRGGLIVNDEPQRWTAQTIGGTVGMFYRRFRSFHQNTINASYTLRRVNSIGSLLEPLDPNTSPPRLPTLGYFSDARLSWRYSDVRQHQFDMFPSFGRSLTLGAAYSGQPSKNDVIEDFREVRLTWGIRRFIENPWVQHQVLAINYRGGWSDSSIGQRGVFSLGGFPDQDFLDSLIDQTFLGGVALRGYAPFSDFGSRFQLVQAEYRFPISFIQRGPQTGPIYADRMWASVFVDGGDAYFDGLDFSDFRWGVGGEIFFRFIIGYYLFYTLRLGFAYGFNEGGGPQFYVHFGVPF